MKALVKENWGHGLSVIDVEMPELRDGEVRIRVIGSAICGSDLHIYESAPGYEWLDLPMTPGHELVGTVESVSQGVSADWVGQRVIVNPYIPCGSCEQCKAGKPNLCDGGKAVMDKIPSAALQIGFRRPGGMAEYVTAPEGNLLPVPDSVSDEVAAMLESFAVSVHATEHVEFHRDSSVLVIGPGPIGLGVVAALKAQGVEHIFMAGLTKDKTRLDIAKALGAAYAFDASVEGYRAVIERETQGRGVDVVIDCSGHPAALTEGINVVKRGGTIVLVGIYGQPAEVAANAVVRAEIKLLGTYGTTPPAFQKALDWVAEGKTDLKPMITHIIDLEQAHEGFSHALDKNGCKVVLKP